MKHFRRAAWLRRLPAALAVFCAPALILANGTSAYASAIVDGTAHPMPSGCIPGLQPWCTIAPSRYPYTPNVNGDCASTTGSSVWNQYTYLNNYTWAYGQLQNPTCTFQPKTKSEDWGPVVPESAIINRCHNTSPANFSAGITSTVSTLVQDTQGVQITLKADIELPKDIKAGIDLAYQYQHTVATINATSTLETNTLGVDPGTAGRLIFQPRIIHTTGQWVALYPKNTDGYTLWSTESVRQPYLQTWSPELVAATGEADGQWKVQLIDCSTLP